MSIVIVNTLESNGVLVRLYFDFRIFNEFQPMMKMQEDNSKLEIVRMWSFRISKEKLTLLGYIRAMMSNASDCAALA